MLMDGFSEQHLNTEEINHENAFEILNTDVINNETPIEANIKETITITPCPKPSVKVAITNGPPYECEICGHSSATKALLASHRHRKHRLKANNFQCDKCEKHFETKPQFEKHLKRPSCDKYPEYTCEYCLKKIIGLSNYNIHLRFHKKIYPFVCDICSKGFMMTVHLKAHIQTKHENKRYLCEEANCGKSFLSQHSLKTHMHVHMDTKPYRCEFCEKMFPNKGRLRWHIQKSHDLKLSLPELDRMLVVGEVISLQNEVMPVELK